MGYESIFLCRCIISVKIQKNFYLLQYKYIVRYHAE